MEVQPQLVLLQKTLLNIEGLGRMLYPELDLWSTAKPFMERWMSEQVGPKAFLRRVKETPAADCPRTCPRCRCWPTACCARRSTAKLQIQWQSEQLEQIREEISSGNRRTRLSIFGGALLVSGILAGGLLGTHVDIEPLWLAGGISGLGLLLLGWAQWR